MRRALGRLLLVPALGAWDVFLPVNRAWWLAFGVPLVALLHWLIGFFAAFPVTLAIGPFGLAVIATTVLVRLVLLPLTVYQVRASLRARREAAALQARLAPAIARLRRRYRGRPAEFQRALLELKQREGVSPLRGLGAGLLPAVVQAPALIALYSAILALAHGGHDLHFLWLANLAVPDPVLLPVLAGLGTYLLGRLTAVPPPADDEQAAATSRTAALLSPLGLAVAGHFAPAALVLYWISGAAVGAAQQWAITRLLERGSPAPA